MEKQFPPFSFNVLRVLDSVFMVEEAVSINNGEDVKIGYALAFYHNLDESWVQYNVTAQFSANGKNFATGTAVTFFGIDNLKAFVGEDGIIMWPSNALETMFGISFNHLRAFMAKNIGATKFSKYIVPIINPVETFRNLMANNPNLQTTIVNEKGEAIEKDPYNSIVENITKKSVEKIRKKHKL
ncbi:hypothetical protein [Mucilaginibacter sp. BT774]|uniref:hypothetical protein n=1 Tax=Mucilaginibacter sp. BT774 TaxID=3062276 RepID=UPI002674A807|nr:hypothetical protein [Mucilaginibacter sp. BT774]MDO3627120.1 hypothetical protein [Mucilaginibacter sp. BT774]